MVIEVRMFEDVVQLEWTADGPPTLPRSTFSPSVACMFFHVDTRLREDLCLRRWWIPDEDTRWWTKPLTEASRDPEVEAEKVVPAVQAPQVSG